MRTHRGIDAAAHQRVFEHFAVHAFAHAVQALQLKLAAALGTHLQNGGNGGSVVRGKLRVDGVGRGQERAGAGQIRHIGVVLVRKHRVVRQTQLLGAFDFSVPIRALDQAAHQAHFVFARHCGDVHYQLQGAGLVGLHGQAKAGPLRLLVRHQGHQGLKHF